jgi:thiosulfate/3-mercaptopyruvate sulfurtransferase
VNGRKPFRNIGVAEAKALIATRAPVIFDVRAKDAYDLAHIGGAQHLTVITMSQITARLPHDVPVLIYCYHGFASQEWGQIFSDFRYQEVYSLEGGYEAWHQALLSAPPYISKQLDSFLASEGFAGAEGLISNRTTALMRAAYKGETAVAQELISLKCDVNARNADGNNALWLACAGNQLDMMAVLVTAGIDINNSNDNGATVLMYASSSGRDWAVRYLLSVGADTSSETLDGFSALDMAATKECLALLRPKLRAPA